LLIQPHFAREDRAFSVTCVVLARHQMPEQRSDPPEALEQEIPPDNLVLMQGYFGNVAPHSAPVGRALQSVFMCSLLGSPLPDLEADEFLSSLAWLFT
jgi:hypothetical protein